jgi:hypothetical protein
VNGAKPVVMIFAREISDPLTSLVKKVDEANQKQGRKMGSFVVMLSDDDGLKGKLEDLSKKEGLKHTALTIDNPAGPRGYNVSKDADVTVVLYINKKVKVNHAFKKGEFKAETVEKVLGDLPKILEK